MTTKRRFKVDKDDRISFVFVVTDPEQAEVFLAELAGTMVDGPLRGVLAILSARSDVALARDRASGLLSKALRYLSENCRGDTDAEAILDGAGYQ